MNDSSYTTRRVAVAMVFLFASAVAAQPQPPDYYQCRLDSVFPAGGQQGTAVTVEFLGRNGGLASPRGIVIDGPPGISVSDVESVSNNNGVKAKFTIAPDAPPGRRWIRVASEQSGLTNFAHFVVSGLPEHVEKESNNTLDDAEEVSQPIVVNGRINPKADIDCFQFTAEKGERLVVGIAAHSLDVHGYGGNYGIADFTLELLDASGRVIAESLDALGYDPLIEYEVPTAGSFTARVKMVAYNGFPQAVYRLTIGEVPYVTSVFPPGVRRGESTEVELRGPNVPPGSKRLITAAPDDHFPVDYVALPGATSGQDVPVIRGDYAELIENEPNGEQSQAIDLPEFTTVNGQFDSPDDADWYRVHVEDKRSVWLQVFAQRFTRSPVDTLLQVYDAGGKLLQENDDDGSTDPGFASYHDFRTTDSSVLIRPPGPGDYYVRVTDTGGSSGPRAVYRLSRSYYSEEPNFRLRHYPDAVPIWGPGSTAALQVRIDWLNYMAFDIDLSIEGLPEGWKGSTAQALSLTQQRKQNRHKDRVFLTITAPLDAAVGTMVPFRIVGRVKHDEETIERVSYPLTWYYTSDTGFFRVAPQSRVVIAKAQGPWLETLVDELTIQQGETSTIPVRVHNPGDLKEMPLVVNLAEGIKCNLGAPVTLPIEGNGRVDVPLVDTDRLPIGNFAITVAQTWRSDIRVGMPGPCTRIIKLNVLPK